MKWKKLVAIGCVVVMAMPSVTACGSNTSDSAVVQEDVTTTESAETNTSVIVQVTAVEGDTITAEVGTLSTVNMGGAPSGEAPEGMPEGEMPSGMPGGSSFESSGETIEFTLESDGTVKTVVMYNAKEEKTTKDITLIICEITNLLNGYTKMKEYYTMKIDISIRRLNHAL